jgi:hypothetical protein
MVNYSDIRLIFFFHYCKELSKTIMRLPVLSLTLLALVNSQLLLDAGLDMI